jgi:hypothetical protein
MHNRTDMCRWGVVALRGEAWLEDPRSGVLLLGRMASYEDLFGRCESDLGCGISSYDAIEG